jgi:tRNA pseudouridine38-40 synthase
VSTFKITLGYDGAEFVGWQRQASGVSIQALVEDALAEIDGKTVPVTGAGRTDAGVHALGQAASFTLDRAIDAETLVRALNNKLPETVRVLSAAEAPARFHARFAARSKTYRYRVWDHAVMPPFERQYAWHVVEPLDVDAMSEAARTLEGPHDFAAFQSAGSTTHSTEREVFRSRIARAPAIASAIGDARAATLPPSPNATAGCLVYDITGNGFLRYMVRTIVGSLVEIGRGHRSTDWLAEVLASRDRARAGPTAPAHGLFLVAVEYGDL